MDCPASEEVPGAMLPQIYLLLGWSSPDLGWSSRDRTKWVKNLVFLASSLLSIGGLLLAFKRRVHGVFLFATLLLFYPLTYYISVPEPRYRHAIEPELVILAMFLISSLPARWRRGDRPNVVRQVEARP